MTLKVRDAVVGDAVAIARVHVLSSDDAYAPLAVSWEAQTIEKRTEDWRQWLTLGRRDADRIDLVAEADAEIVGFITVGTSRERNVDAELEVYVIHVLPAHRGHGVGKQLWTEACRARGPALRSMCVNTFAELPCCRFYEGFGGEVVSREPTDFFGAAVTEVVYRWGPGVTSVARER